MAISMSTTLMDIAKRTDKDGKILPIIETLAQDNEILQDMLWQECNQGTNHVTTVRTGLPTVFWRKYNQGVPSSKSTTKKVTDSTAMLEAYSNVDKKLADIQTDARAYRQSEDVAFLESMNQKVATTVFYGSAANSEEFFGLTERYNDTTAENSKNILDGGGSGSTNTSIWLVGWGDRSIHGLYPRNSKAGFTQEDKGVQMVSDANSQQFDAYVTKYGWDPGMSVRDWRYAVRIANVDVPALKSGTGAADLVTLMIKARNLIPRNRAGIRLAFYCREEVFTRLELQLVAKTNAVLSWRELQGQQVLSFGDIPIRKVDALLATEAKVTFA